MLKSKAIELLGGTIAAAAAELGVTYQAIDKWPDDLSERVAQRVLGVVAKKRYPELAAEMVANPGESHPATVKATTEAA